MNALLLKNARVLDVETGRYDEGDVRIADGVIVERGDRLIADSVQTVDLAGSFVLPGLIDCHVHVTAATANLSELRSWSRSYLAFRTANNMEAMLDRGFTTVRDLGGADFGVADAQAEGLFRGPRLLFCGQPLSQTGGHGDDRPRGDDQCYSTGMSRVVDGVDAVRAAARDELRKGATHLKVMASGGVASPTDRIDSTQYSVPELEAVVEEAEAAGRYVAAHAYTAKAVERALRAGVRTIEHGNLIDESSVALLNERQAFLVMNLVTYWALQEEGRSFGLPEESWSKVADVLEGGYKALELASRGGVKIGYGTDLLGGMQKYQSREFAIRAEIQPAIDVIRSATCTAAEVVQMGGRIGTTRAGAFGDLVVLDRDPLDDPGVLARPECMTHVIQGGNIVVRR